MHLYFLSIPANRFKSKSFSYSSQIDVLNLIYILIFELLLCCLKKDERYFIGYLVMFSWTLSSTRVNCISQNTKNLPRMKPPHPCAAAWRPLWDQGCSCWKERWPTHCSGSSWCTLTPCQRCPQHPFLSQKTLCCVSEGVSLSQWSRSNIKTISRQLLIIIITFSMFGNSLRMFLAQPENIPWVAKT